jgi:alanyl-tRNA synthetase
MRVHAMVDAGRRRRVQAHHTATHLLHAALREVLGTHVKQAGSVVEPERLRFDFTHFAPMDQDQIADVELRATLQALAAMPLAVKEMGIEDALASGATALFGEKYGDEVRVVKIGDFSTELCGGTHVANTGEVGLVKIVGECAVSAGVRRIEAVAGEAALGLFQANEATLHAIARQANAPREGLPAFLAARGQRMEQLEKELKDAKLKAAQNGGQAEASETIDGAELVTAAVEGLDTPALREMMDQVRTRHRSAVIALASTLEGRVSLLVSVAPDLQQRLDAGALLKAMLPHVDGRGGGKKDLAQGGGAKPEGIPEAFRALRGKI